MYVNRDIDIFHKLRFLRQVLIQRVNSPEYFGSVVFSSKWEYTVIISSKSRTLIFAKDIDGVSRYCEVSLNALVIANFVIVAFV